MESLLEPSEECTVFVPFYMRGHWSREIKFSTQGAIFHTCRRPSWDPGILILLASLSIRKLDTGVL